MDIRRQQTLSHCVKMSQLNMKFVSSVFRSFSIGYFGLQYHKPCFILEQKSGLKLLLNWNFSVLFSFSHRLSPSVARISTDAAGHSTGRCPLGRDGFCNHPWTLKNFLRISKFFSSNSWDISCIYLKLGSIHPWTPTDQCSVTNNNLGGHFLH